MPPETVGLVVSGPYMPGKTRQRLRRLVEKRPDLRLLEFIPEPAALIQRADRVISMGGYNTMCEVLSFEKHALIVPRVSPKPEQFIRAQRMQELGLVEMLHPSKLSPRAITDWLARDLGSPPPSRSRIDFGGLKRISGLLGELLKVSPARAPKTIPA
jgi:predicted glycosyltransferase